MQKFKFPRLEDRLKKSVPAAATVIAAAPPAPVDEPTHDEDGRLLIKTPVRPLPRPLPTILRDTRPAPAQPERPTVSSGASDVGSEGSAPATADSPAPTGAVAGADAQARRHTVLGLTIHLWHDDGYRAYLEKEALTSPAAALLLGDGWRPLAEYVYDRKYVYAVGIDGALLPRLFVGRGGKYESSYWYTPSQTEIPVSLYVTHWQPLPEGKSIEDIKREVFGIEPPVPWARQPEQVFEPGGPDARLTPAPRDLLRAMQAGAVLRERVYKWSGWTLQRPGEQPTKQTTAALSRLRETAFIARDGALPDRLGWYDFEWRITFAGRAWLAAH